MKKIIAVILCLTLLFQFSVCCFAAETTEVFYDSVTHINPIYADVIDEADIEESTDNYPSVLFAVGKQEYNDTIEEAGAEMRQKLVERVPSIEVTFVADAYNQEYFNSIFNEAIKHTGEPTEGDYIAWHYGGWKGGVSYYHSGNKCYMTFKYNMTYYTTAEQEAELDIAVDNLLALLDLEGKDNYQKICAIYDYLCENITYDYDNLNKDEYTLKYSAYAALINKTSVCQGYANLFYRLALEEGIDSRLISGWGNNGPHGWNIVQMADYYYNLDATWDAGREEYDYFLKCEKNFGDHIRSAEHDSAAFNSAYPMGASDYVYDPDDFTEQEDPIPSVPEDRTLIHFPTIDLNKEESFFIDSCGAKFYISLDSLNFNKVRLSGSEELRNIKITSNGNVSARLVDYDPETMVDYLGNDEDNKFVTYKVWDSAKGKNVVTGVSYFEAKGIAEKSANYSVVAENAVNLVEITVGENYSSVWKEGVLKISATIDGQEYATAMTFISDVVVFEYEEVKWAAKNDALIRIGGYGYSDYCNYYGKYIVVEGATTVSTTAFRAIEGEEILIYASDYMDVVLANIASGQSGVNFSNYFDIDFEDSDYDNIWDIYGENLNAIEFGFYGDQIIKGKYAIVTYLPWNYGELRDIFGLSMADVVSYYIVDKDNNILKQIKVDYTLVNSEVEVAISLHGENEPLGEYKLVVEVPAADEEEIIASGYCGGEGDGTNLEWNLSESGTLTISGTGAMADYFNEWSEEAQDYVLNRPWEAYKDQIKKLVLGEGITRIGSYSFCQLRNAKCELVIPSTVKVIGNSAFWDSDFVGELVLPEGLEKLESYALINNEFTYVYIPSTLTEMEFRVFCNHWNLEEFDVSEENPAFCDVEGVIFTKDKKELVYFPGGRTGEYSVPKGTKVIRENAFYAISITDLYIPASVELIKSNAFSYYDFNITIDEKNKVYTIIDDSLYGKAAMELIAYLGDNEEVYVVPEGTKVIWEDAFFSKKIGQVVLPKSLERIKQGAFGNFKGDVFVEGRIENVDRWAFWRDNEDINIFFMAGAPYNIGEYAFDSEDMINLYYLDGTEILWDFEKDGTWNGYDVYPFDFTDGPKFDSEKYVAQGFCGDEYLGMNLIWNLDKEGTLTISGEGAMADYRQVFVNEGMYSSAPWGLLGDEIKAIVIEEGVTHIGDSAFYGWTAVKDVTIPASVKSIGNLGFFGKRGNFYVKGQLEFVETVAFGSMNKMTNIYFVDGAPLDCEEGAFGEGTSIANLFYYSGTEDKWEFDKNGLWNGYKVTKCGQNGFVMGDINKDGKVDVKDVYMARIFAAKLTVPTAEELELGDVDGNGRINVVDANLIRKFVLKNIIKFPVEA